MAEQSLSEQLEKYRARRFPEYPPPTFPHCARTRPTTGVATNVARCGPSRERSTCTPPHACRRRFFVCRELHGRPAEQWRWPGWFPDTTQEVTLRHPGQTRRLDSE